MTVPREETEERQARPRRARKARGGSPFARQASEGGEASQLFSGMGALAERAREFKPTAREIRAEQHEHRVAEGPSVEELKSDPLALERALRRREVKRIAARANPLSPDTEHVFTADGARYAKTGVYVPTIGERISEAKRGVRAGGEAWWDKNKKVVVLGALGVTAAFVLYGAWKNAELKKRLDAARVYTPPQTHPGSPWAAPQHHTGFYPGLHPIYYTPPPPPYVPYEGGEDGEWQETWGGYP